MDATLPCKKGTESPSSSRVTGARLNASNKVPKTKYACIVETHESTSQRMEPSLPKKHEDHIAGKGYNSMTRYNLAHKFIPMPQAMNIPDAKAAVDKEWKVLETIPLWDLIVSVLGNTIQTPERPGRPVVNDKEQRSQGMTNALNHIDFVPSDVQISHQEALLYVFEDNEAVIKMIIRGRSPTMRHVSRNHRVALDWLFDRINLDPKIHIKYIDTKNQLADILTKWNFTRDEWNHLLCLFNISHFSSTVCSETMAKRLQQDSGEERVTTNSRPMMSFIARVPSNVSSSTSVSPGKRSHGHQNPWSTTAEKEEGPDVGSDRKTAFDYYYHEQFMESFSSASYSKWDDDHAWSSQEWKTDTEMCERPRRPDVTSWGATRESQPCSLTRKLSMMEPRNPLWMS